MKKQKKFMFDNTEYKIELFTLDVKPARFLFLNLGSKTQIDINVGPETLTKSLSTTQKADEVEKDNVNYNYEKIGKDKVDLNDDKKKDILISITSISFSEKEIKVKLENLNPSKKLVKITIKS